MSGPSTSIIKHSMGVGVKTDEPIKMPFVGRLGWAKGTLY